ncbi:hypothetical protein DL96DRAFT_1525614 [Flagelloscypha sp. PMI_526]|nr:hypothetical protein DL96DRAFT_1525614 [Flagelloscypha sp. PMI_526]
MEMSSSLLLQSQGKRRARSSDSSPPEELEEEEVPRAKKPKRAETRECPVCNEAIPVRLLHAHADLESRRVEEIISSIGMDTTVTPPDEPSSSRNRRSAQKARQSISLQSSSRSDDAMKMLQDIKRRRKQRGTKLKEIALQAEDDPPPNAQRRGRNSIENIVCPVCSQNVSGTDEQVEEHIDMCLMTAASHAAQEMEQAGQEQQHQQQLEDGDGGAFVGDLQGAGFHRRNQHDVDVEDDIDIDGDDEAQYGRAQFNEGDILGLNENTEVDIGGDRNDEQALRDLISEGKIVKRGDIAEAKGEIEEVIGLADADKAEARITQAKMSGDPVQLIAALEDKVKLLESAKVSASTALLCRICLDPYNEPTVSIGCFHTSCRECWLRCLGSTKLCPICKRITNASDLRRVYL